MALTTTHLLLVLFTLFSLSTGKRMRWIPSLSLTNPDNWEPRGAPCRNDHVMFPAKAPPVYVQTNQTLMELVLPNDGEIIFADGAILTFPETADSSCVGRNVVFTGVTAKSWFDPVNWCVTVDSSSVDCMTVQPDLLDTERIPCQSDDVIFVSGTSFFVDLQSDAQIRVASLRLGSEQVNTDSFRSYLLSESGRKQFIGQNSSIATPTTVTIGGPVCTDVTGCSCGNLRSSTRICAVQSNRCAHVSCRGAILPEGHCCHFCGALLSMDHGSGFKLNNLRNLITDTFRKLNVDPEVAKLILSKLDDDRIQIVLESTSDDGISGAVEVGRSLKEDLDKDPRFGAVRVNLTVSEGNSPEAHKGERVSAISSGGIVGIIFVILLVVIVLLTAVYCYRNRGKFNRPRLPDISLPSPPDFRRFFRRQDGDGGSGTEFELRHQSSVSFDNRVFEGNLSGFENPTYGDLFTGLPSQTIGPEKGGFSNPMYPTTTTTEPTFISKDSSSPPPDYILYDVPPKDPSRKERKTKPDAALQTKGQAKGSGGDTNDNSSERKTDVLGKMLMSPFRMVASRLRGTRLEEEVEDEVVEPPKVERPKEEVTRRDEEQPEVEKKRARVKLGRAKDHERLEETGGDGGEDVEEDERKKEEQRMEKRAVAEESGAGFGNPLYGGSDDPGTVVDRDLGEAGSAGAVGDDRTRRRRAGFENPLFEDSKEKLQRSDETRSVSVAGATEADEESRA